jgi:hypothetical protein
MNLAEERNSWHSEFDAGFEPFYIKEYRKKRDDECWRASRGFEQVCEYVLYLEKKLDSLKDEKLGQSGQ